jgi:hypothetical protein
MTTRQFSRVHFNVEATIRTADRELTGNVENLSMNGMFMFTDERLPVDEVVDITIVLTGVTPEIALTISGRVCRETEDGLGFTFDRIGPESYMHLKNIIAYNIDDAEKVMAEIRHSIDEKIAAE